MRDSKYWRQNGFSGATATRHFLALLSIAVTRRILMLVKKLRRDAKNHFKGAVTWHSLCAKNYVGV